VWFHDQQAENLIKEANHDAAAGLSVGALADDCTTSNW